MTQPRRINLDEQAKELSCTTAILADGAVTGVKLAAGAITGSAIAPGTIGANKLNSSVFGNGLVYNNINDSIDVNVDNVTLQIVSDTIKLKSVILENFSSDPVAGTPGRLIWRTDLQEVHVDTGTFVIPLASSGVVPGGVNGSIQFNNSGTLGGSANLTFLSNTLSVTGSISATGISTSTLQITASPTAGYVLTSDSSGNGTWQAPTGGGHVIEDHGTPLTQRAFLNFVGAGVTVTDTGTETQVSITATGSGSSYAKDSVTVSSPSLDHTITLSHTPVINSEIISLNGLVLKLGASNDYTISGNVITINVGVTLTVGDEIMIVYAY